MFLQRLWTPAIGIAAIVALPLVVAADAQWPHRGWHHGGPMHDITETRVTGTVEAVNDVAGPGGNCCCGTGGGTHVTVKTTTESIEAHLGPTAWLREQGVDLTEGDVVDISGWRVTMGETPVLLAREITKGSTTWTLRHGTGRGAGGCCR
jgi:hypothetical protein